MFDYRPQVDDQREAFDAAKARLAAACSKVIVETLADVLDTRQGAAACPPLVSDSTDDPLTLLIYTSGSTGAPKGAMYPSALVANIWRRASGSRGDAA